MYRLNEQQQAIADQASEIAQSVIAEHAADVDRTSSLSKGEPEGSWRMLDSMD